jgi:hypothetical protein
MIAFIKEKLLTQVVNIILVIKQLIHRLEIDLRSSTVDKDNLVIDALEVAGLGGILCTIHHIYTLM